MYIQVRTIDAQNKVRIDVSRTTSILCLKKELEQHFGIKPERQRLFFRGKQLEDEYTIFDYDINLNDVVQIMERVIIDPVDEDKNKAKEDQDNSIDENKPSTSQQDADEACSSTSSDESVLSNTYFREGEFVDIRDMAYGAWFEGQIVRIIRDNHLEENLKKFRGDVEHGAPHDGYFYKISCLEDDGETSFVVTCRLKDIRPRSIEKIPYSELKVGDRILANYNIEEPTRRGFWYDCVITQLKKEGRKKEDCIYADVEVGAAIIENCKLRFPNEVLRINERMPCSFRDPSTGDDPPTRITEGPISCDHCRDKTRLKCKECGCHVCGLKTEEYKQILCDECDYAYHIYCLKPPLEDVPDDEEWYCMNCKNDENEIVNAGAKLKESKKKAKMASKQNKTTRDWGKGMACVGRTKICSIVPQHHFGPIPGVEVGTLWKFRIQVSEAGVHRPHVAGIHGRENMGAFSVVLSGGYEDDIDYGDEFLYTGSGGRDLTGNKRTNAQGFDQKLTRLNKAIALNCNVPLNAKGGEAKNWREGKPVRVVRNYKLSKHSKFAPKEGNRYDGIYKVVKYYPEKGQSGFIVWRYLFRRDDPDPAPWTEEGKARSKALGLKMQYPEGYEERENCANLDEEGEENESEATPKSKTKKKGKKRVLEESSNSQTQVTKKAKTAEYKLEDNISSAINKDTDNKKLWDECKSELDSGKSKFIAKVEEEFTCICCTEIVFKPVTTPCFHNFCSGCMKRSFDAQVMTCPTCRSPLEKSLLNKVNTSLQDALDLLFPGYSKCR